MGMFVALRFRTPSTVVAALILFLGIAPSDRCRRTFPGDPHSRCDRDLELTGLTTLKWNSASVL